MPDLKYNILITDDHPIYRSGLKNILRKNPLFGHIYEASNGKEALSVIKSENVDVTLMDIDMPEMNGVTATAAIMAEHPETKIVALTMFCEPKMVVGMCKNGAKGYLLKDAHPDEISKALSMILNNEEYYSPKVQNILASVYRDFDNNLEFNSKADITNMQAAVLKLLCEQQSSEEIADLLHVSVKTVHRHREDLLSRTGATNLAGLVIYAIENQFIRVNIK